MTDKILGTDSYKGVRDFYPEDMAVQRYIFSVWSDTAESFGFERYDASILEPSDLYKAKGAENEEMVNEQTYTFIDRGEREVTLRPEMTPTVARMVAGKRRELSFPVRWYSIPNLFRYERPQRGRLREHWQLNCDIFGTNDFTADVEIIALAYQMLLNFGADSKNFEIRINNKQLMTSFFPEKYNITDIEILRQVSGVLDRKRKVTESIFDGLLEEFVHERFEELREDLKLDIDDFVKLLNAENQGSTLIQVKNGLKELGIENVVFDASLARGFNYYTGTIFEIFELDKDGTTTGRAMLGGGRYDNLTEMFGGEAITGIGFGMGDVTMRDFLETHKLPTSHKTAIDIFIVPMEKKFNLNGLNIAKKIRENGYSCTVDISEKSFKKKTESLKKRNIISYLVIGENEIKLEEYVLRSSLNEFINVSGKIDEILGTIKNYSCFPGSKQWIENRNFINTLK